MNGPVSAPSWKTWAGAVATIAAVFILLVAGLTLRSRQEVRQQILDRDAHVLAGVASMLQWTDSPALLRDDLEIALQTSRLRGVLAVRLFDPNGDFHFAIPFEVAEAVLTEDDHSALLAGRPVAHFHPDARLADIFDLSLDEPVEGPTPLQEILIPLRNEDTADEISSIVQYLIDGDPVKTEFAALDRTLLRQAGSALTLGLAGLILIAALAFVRLRESHRALAAQTDRLIKANKELSLAARTSAVGAITAHLIHGIRNPLTGLDLFFQTRNTAELPGQSPESWKQLADATYKIKDLVDDVVDVLRDQEMAATYELTLEELESVLQEKLRPKATQVGVRFETRRTGDAALTGHAANIVLLILINLFDNALSLTPKEKRIWVEIVREGPFVRFEVGDEGPGIPAEIQPDLFTPGKSGRPGGTGLGLAISHRLAANLNAHLSLQRSSENGTVFALEYPLEASPGQANITPAEKRRP